MISSIMVSDVEGANKITINAFIQTVVGIFFAQFKRISIGLFSGIIVCRAKIPCRTSTFDDS